MNEGRSLYEQQRASFGGDPCLNGFKTNRKNFEQFMSYSHAQRLVSSQFPARTAVVFFAT